MSRQAQEIIEIFKECGREVQAEGNRPLLLNGTDDFWLISEGKVEVFIVPVLVDGQTGARSRLFSARAGDILCGSGSKYDFGLLAAGGRGTRLLRLDRNTLAGHLQERQAVAQFAGLLAGWTGGVMSGIRCGKADEDYIPLSSELSPPSSKQTAVKAAGEHVLVELVGGRATLTGKAEWPAVEPGFFCLAGGLFLSLEPGARVRAVEPPDISALFTALDNFHRILYPGIAVEIEVKRKETAAIQKRSREEHREKYSAALKGFMDVLHRPDADERVKIDRRRPLLTACRMLASLQKLTIVEPRLKRGDKGEPSPEDIARASRFRIREVLLRDDWWHHDNGPLLAFRMADRAPMVLIPVSPKKYLLRNPEDGSSVRVNREVAANLHPSARMFYRPFPIGRVRLRDFYELGIKSRLKDGGTLLLAGCVSSFLALLTPIMTGIVFDHVIPDASQGQMLQIAFILLSCTVAKALFDLTGGFARFRIQSYVGGVTQAAVWDRLLSLPVPFFRDFTAGDLANRSLGISAIQDTLSGVLVTAVLSSLFSVFNLGLLFYYDVKMAVLGIALTLIMIAAAVSINLCRLAMQKEIMALEGKNSGLLFQLISGITKLRVSGTEERAFNKWAEIFTRKRELAFRAGILQNIQVTFNAGFPILASMAIFYMMVQGLQGEKPISTGRFLAFVAAYGAFQGAFLAMTSAVTESLQIIPLWERVKPILDAVPEFDEAREDPGMLKGSIEARHISFRYHADKPPVLTDVSFTVNPGEFVAIVGGSGSGKSTLLRLLLGFEQAEEGTIYFDNKPLDSLDIREVRRQIGVVLQNSQVMSGTIFSNIIGQAPLTLADAEEAARMVGLEKDIAAMPMGMHTVISAGGGTLSGGQRQRLIIARAIVNRPPILFLDEATAALDNKTQTVVSKSLERLQVTRVVIAHRLSTIINADRIYVMDGGKIVEQGNYNELLDRNGIFAELVKRQIS
ncbi:MAG: NHLP bacteriocin export ABC transporter permease/ATPase subunit [Deltaproteobacteria bacterium]|nr:MAG: NHLP bacteriocin export ABC transporter permease/ATPase subunit [Deltaproteobacteria bacterium]